MIDGGEVIRKVALNVARYTGLAPLARPLVGGIGAILMLHRVTAAPERPLGVNRHLSITPDFLDAVISDMKTGGYVFVSMEEAVERIKQGGAGGLFAVLTADDAMRTGYDPQDLRFTIPVSTANGVANAARVVADEIVIGSISRKRLPLLVVEAGRLDQSLLGMNFIGSLSGFDLRGDRLILRD